MDDGRAYAVDSLLPRVAKQFKTKPAERLRQLSAEPGGKLPATVTTPSSTDRGLTPMPDSRLATAMRHLSHTMFFIYNVVSDINKKR